MRITDQHPYQRVPNSIQFDTLQYFVYTTIVKGDTIMTAGKRGVFTFDLPTLNQSANMQFKDNVNCCVPIDRSSALVLKHDNSVSIVNNDTQKSDILLFGGLYFNRQILPVDEHMWMVSSRGEKHCLVRANQRQGSFRIIAGIGDGHQKLVYRGCLLQNKLITCSTDLTVKIADINTLELQNSIKLDHKPFTLVKMNNNQFIVGGLDSRLKLFDLRTNRFSLLLNTTKPQTYSGIWTTDNRLLVSHGATVCQYDIRGLAPVPFNRSFCGRVWNIHQWRDSLVMTGNNFITLCP